MLALVSVRGMGLYSSHRNVCAWRSESVLGDMPCMRAGLQYLGNAVGGIPYIRFGAQIPIGSNRIYIYIYINIYIYICIYIYITIYI